MNILALETATSTCSVALHSRGQIVAECSLHRPRAHSEYLVSLIKDVLRYADVDRTEVDAVAVSSGPGSYTGLRIGVSTAKGFASAVEAELVSVPSLLALADGVRPYVQRNDHIAAAFDARRDEVYAALYRVEAGGALVSEEETSVWTETQVLSWIDADRSGALFAVGDGWTKMRDRLGGDGCHILSSTEVSPSAASVARLGAEKLSRGDVENVVTFEPYYLKEFVATKPTASAFERLSF